MEGQNEVAAAFAAPDIKKEVIPGKNRKDYAYQEWWTLSRHEKLFSSPAYIPTTL